MSGRLLPNHWVYIVRDTGTGCIKVGKSCKEAGIAGRVKSLQTGCAFDLELVATFSPREHPGEDVLHARLSRWRVRTNGEWFYGVDDVYAALAIRRPSRRGRYEDAVTACFDKRYTNARTALRTVERFHMLGIDLPKIAGVV